MTPSLLAAHFLADKYEFSLRSSFTSRPQHRRLTEMSRSRTDSYLCISRLLTFYIIKCLNENKGVKMELKST